MLTSTYYHIQMVENCYCSAIILIL